MAEKVVDVFLRDRLVASYPVTLGMLDGPTADREYIELARNAMREDGYSAEDIAGARFSVRAIPE